MELPDITAYRTDEGLLVQRGDELFRLADSDIDSLFAQKEPASWLRAQLISAIPVLAPSEWLPPIQSQEVWAAGVTYLRSRDARIDEVKQAGGSSANFYDQVYDAKRPELFFKATPHRVVGPGGKVRIRSDGAWNVPEPEIALAINLRGRIFGYTIGNDMSARDIEGENPLYLPQAKVYSACCALGPGIVVRETLPRSTAIEMEVRRGGVSIFAGETSLESMKRDFAELAAFLFRDNDFPTGCFLLTGTGIVPPNEFTLARGDEIRIRVTGLGMLINSVA